jgi:hypothetical protein
MKFTNKNICDKSFRSPKIRKGSGFRVPGSGFEISLFQVLGIGRKLKMNSEK